MGNLAPTRAIVFFSSFSSSFFKRALVLLQLRREGGEEGGLVGEGGEKGTVFLSVSICRIAITSIALYVRVYLYPLPSPPPPHLHHRCSYEDTLGPGADCSRWITHVNHLGEEVGVDYVWYRNPDPGLQPMEPEWGSIVYQVCRASTKERRQASVFQSVCTFAIYVAKACFDGRVRSRCIYIYTVRGIINWCLYSRQQAASQTAFTATAKIVFCWFL